MSRNAQLTPTDNLTAFHNTLSPGAMGDIIQAAMDEPMATDEHSAGGVAAPIRVKRRLNVSINGSLSMFNAKGPTAGQWKPVDGKHVDVFGISAFEGTALDHGAISNALRNAIVLKVRFLEQKSTFPVPLGISMNCVHPDEVTDMGEKYVATVLPNSQNQTPLTVFETDSSSAEGIEWRKKYPHYNANNLESWGVMEVKNCPYVFVHKTHPMIALLRVNKHLLGADIEEQVPMDNQWFKITRQVLNSCCTMLRQKVLSRVSTRDLNQFTIQLHRIGEPNWDAVGDGTDLLSDFIPNPTWTNDQRIDAEARYMEMMLKKPCTYMSRLELEYEIQP